MTPWSAVAHVTVVLAMPIFVVGVINRVKARWAGRRGPPILQPWFELRRLVAKSSVYSDTTSWVFRAGPLVVLATSAITAFMVPVIGPAAPWSFPFDCVAVAYLWGLGRLFMILAALDTGSAFEGMGASREAIYGALVEPALFLVFGALVAVNGASSLSGMLAPPLLGVGGLLMTVGCLVALFVVLQVESARVPIDDPTTHLELTMIHEVMILDHSGPDLAALQYASGLKLTLGAALVASIVVPISTTPLYTAAIRLAAIFVIAVLIACVESLVARLRLRAVPQFILIAIVGAFIALLSAAFRARGVA